MAKPLNPYQGSAPAAMSQMGAGVMEAGANIGRTLQSGYEALGSGLASGIKSAAGSIAGAYTQNKEEQAKYNATQKVFSAFESVLPKQTNPQTGEVTSPIADKVKSIFADTSMSVAEKNAMAPMLLNFLAQAQQQYGVSEQQKAAMDRLKYSEGAATGRQAASIEAQQAQPFFEQEARYSPLDAKFTNSFSGDRNLSIQSQTPIKSIFKRHFVQ